MSQKLIPIISVAVGIFAFFLSQQYFGKKQREIDAQWKKFHNAQAKESVVIARRDIPRGLKIVATDITTNMMIKTSIPQDAVRQRDGNYIFGKKTTMRIGKGEVITWSVIEGAVRRAGLSPSPPSARATPSPRWNRTVPGHAEAWATQTVPPLGRWPPGPRHTRAPSPVAPAAP